MWGLADNVAVAESVASRADYPFWISTGIAVAVLVAMIVDNFRQRKHDRLMVRPIISFSRSRHKESATLGVENRGIGPAIIRKIVYFVDWEQVRPTPGNLKMFGEMLEACGLEEKACLYRLIGLDTAMLPGDVVNLVEYDAKKADKPVAHNKPESIGLDRLGFVILFESAYGEEDANCAFSSLALRERVVGTDKSAKTLWARFGDD